MGSAFQEDVQIAERHENRRAGPGREFHSPDFGALPDFRRRAEVRNAREDRGGYDSFEILFVADANVGEFEERGETSSEGEPRREAAETEAQAIRSRRLLRKARRIDDAELLPFLALLEAGGQLRLHLLLQQGVVIRFGFLVSA